MQRRELLATVGNLGAAATLGATTRALAGTPVPAVTAFSSSFLDVPESRGPTRVQFDRPLPEQLSGTVFRNGPARMQRGATRYRHWFDGDGMVHSFRMHGASLTHRSRMVRTSRYVAEEAAGRFLWDGFGTGFVDARTTRQPDDVNVANISVLPMGDELLALWEAGSAWRIDPLTLETLGRKVFSEDTDGVSFSAHPRVDRDGRIWNFGYMSGSGKLVLYDIAPSGRLQRTALIDAPNADMVHDFAITERFLVFVLMPIEYLDNKPPTGVGFLQRLHWNADAPVIALLVDKSTLAVVHRFELAPFHAFHLGNAWEDGDTVRIEVAQAPAFDALMRHVENATVGAPPGPALAGEPALDISLDLRRGRAHSDKLPVTFSDFPRYDLRHSGSRTTRLSLLTRGSSMPREVFGFNTVVSLDRRGEQLQRHEYGEHAIAEEHLFVPAPGGREGQGWLVGTVFDWRAGRTELAVLDAGAVDAGPIARAQLPYSLPLGFHGQFVPG